MKQSAAVEPARTHMRPDERRELYRWLAAIAIMDEHDLDKRVATIPNGKRDLAMIRNRMSNLLGQVYDTMLYEELVALRANARAIHCTVGVVPVRNTELDDYGRWLSYRELDTLIKAAHEGCLMCSLDNAAKRKCGLRKVLLRIDGQMPDCDCNV